MNLPAIGARIGVRNGTNGAWMPFTVAEVTARDLRCTSPIFGDARQVAFSLTGDIPADPPSWHWQPWAQCPVLLEPCKKCKGVGEVLSKKKGETYRQCPDCKGEGVKARHDPFEDPD
jgi:hypothetical protein